MAQKTLICLKDVWKIYKLGKVDLAALRGVSLDIHQGAFVTLMGASGSGKSTLLNMVGCLDVPTKGKIYLEGKDISEMSQDQLSQVRGNKIGFVFQQFNLLPNLTALENVVLPTIFQKMPVDKRIKRAKELLETFELGERMNHKPSELSGGEQQRVAIARALANDPEIIVADEPTGNLDSTTGRKIMEILVSLHRNGKKTIVVVTHDPKIANYSKEVVNILDGQITKNHHHAEKVLWENNNKR